MEAYVLMLTPGTVHSDIFIKITLQDSLGYGQQHGICLLKILSAPCRVEPYDFGILSPDKVQIRNRNTAVPAETTGQKVRIGTEFQGALCLPVKRSSCRSLDIYDSVNSVICAVYEIHVSANQYVIMDLTCLRIEHRILKVRFHSHWINKINLR